MITFFRSLSILDWLGTAIILALILIGLIAGDTNTHRTSEHFLTPVDSLIGSPHRYSHNQSVMNIIVESLTATLQYYSSRESDRSQSRALFSAFLAAFVVAYFSIEDTKKRRVLVFALIALGILLYMNDVQTADLNNRTIETNKRYENAMFILLNASPSDSVWYDLDQAKIQASIADTSRPMKVARKIVRALMPDLPQDAFFLAPLFFLIILNRLVVNFERKANRA